MPDKRTALKTIAEKLEGHHWFIDSGMAVEIYTKGKRIAKDIDIVTLEDEFEEVARRLNAKITVRSVDKGKLKIFWEKYASGLVEGVKVEIVCGSGKVTIRGKERNMKVTSDHLVCVKRLRYLGVEVNVAPREEIIVHKSLMGRE